MNGSVCELPVVSMGLCELLSEVSMGLCELLSEVSMGRYAQCSVNGSVCAA